MKVIEKLYLAGPSGAISYSLPRSAKVLMVGEHMREVFVWVEKDDTSTILDLTEFYSCCEGDPLPVGAEHIGSFVATGTQRVYHIYMRREYAE